jgi:tetratricopeptide (TPR) repeat protein
MWTVRRSPRFAMVLTGLLLSALLSPAEEQQSRKLDLQFQSAMAQYDAGRYPEAAAELEALLPLVPKSFEVHEVLGLVYAAQSLNAKALEQLTTAVRLKPDSAVARTNLATSLWHAGKVDLAAKEFERALALEPHDFDAQHNLGEFYVQSGKIAAAIPHLEEAQRTKSTSYENGYDLALAYSLTGRLPQARELVQQLVKEKDNGELHNLLGQIEEKDGKFLGAANEYEIAAHMDPSEDNLFEWGSELLLHRTYDPAIEVFEQATQRFPTSPRLMIGLGMALYWRGKYDDSIKALLTAIDLNPADPRCYLFLSKAYDNSPSQAEEVLERFRRYAELKPGNALAQYYYAMSLWKGKPTDNSSVDLHAVESLLKKSIALDGASAESHLQLGNLYADQHEFARSFPEYQRALELSPNLPDAHYRLGQYYVHVGQKDRAQKEFDVYQRLRTQRQADLDKQAAEVRQFVYSAKDAPVAKQ